MKTANVYLLIGLLSAAMVLGCAVYQPQEIPLALTVPDRYGAPVPAGENWPDDDQWWVVFNDENLNDLMEKAFTANLDLAQAFSRLEQFEASARQTNAIRYPSLGLEGRAARLGQPANPKDVSGNATEISLGASFGVDLWKKMKHRYDARGFEAAASREDIRTLYLVLSAQVADLYYGMIEQRALIDLTRQTISAREGNLELVEQRYLEGIVSALDVYQARQILAGTLTRLPGYEARLHRTAHGISLLLGQYPTKEIGGDLAVLPSLTVAFPQGLPSELLTRRPDIRAELLRLKAKDAAIGAAVAERFPSINLLAGIGASESNVGVDVSGMTWNLAANLFMPLLDWGNRKSEVDRTQAVFQEQYHRYRKTVLTAFREVEDALVSNHANGAVVGRLEGEEAAARATLRLALDRYRDGLSDYLPVLTAEASHFNAQTRLLSAKRQLISARINLATAMGGHWMDGTITHRRMQIAKIPQGITRIHKMTKRKVFFRLFLCVLVLGLGFGIMQLMTSMKKAPDRQVTVSQATLVETIQLDSGDRQVLVWGTGTVQPRQSSSIVPEVSGKITALAPTFVAGGFFKQGDLLFEIESVDYEVAMAKSEAAVAQAEYELARIESQARVARTEWQRIALDGKAEPNPLVLFEPQLKNAQALLASAEADLEMRQLNIRRTKLRAPFNCLIQSESVDLGQRVGPGKSVAVISGTDRAEIIVPVSLEDAQWLTIPRNQKQKEKGSSADVFIDINGRQFKWQGQIDRSLGELDPKTRMLQLVVQVQDPFRLKGASPSLNPFNLEYRMFVDVRLKGETVSDVFSLPVDALREQSSIWVMNADNTLDIRKVHILRREKDRILIKGGLDRQDRIVLTYLSGAVPGMRLRLAEESP